MGYDLSRFISKVHEDLLCPICLGVLENPFEISSCGHLFCESCIRRWADNPIFGPATCPIDRHEVSQKNLKPAPRFLRNYLNQLLVKCEFAGKGCAVSVPLDSVAAHRQVCSLNPENPIGCIRGCGLKLPPKWMKSHKCTIDPCQDAFIWSQILEAAKPKRSNIQTKPEQFDKIVDVSETTKPTKGQGNRVSELGW